MSPRRVFAHNHMVSKSYPKKNAVSDVVARLLPELLQPSHSCILQRAVRSRIATAFWRGLVRPSQTQFFSLLLNLVAPRPRLVPILCCALLPLHPEARIDVALRVVAHARRLVKEAASVTFLESLDDLYAGFGAVSGAD